MFRVQPHQHRSLGDQDFFDRLEVFIAEDAFGRKVSAEERARLPFRAMIEHGVEVARSYGLETERDLSLFVLNMITINPEFHRQPRIHALLRDPALAPPERREKLLKDVSDEDWSEAATMTDPDRYWSRVLPSGS